MGPTMSVSHAILSGGRTQYHPLMSALAAKIEWETLMVSPNDVF